MEDGLWQELLVKKYLKGNPISVVKHKLDDSPIWTDLLKSDRCIWGSSYSCHEWEKNSILEGSVAER